MRTILIMALCAYLSVLVGCTSSSGFYSNIYEGLKTREAIVHPSVEERLPEKSMLYQEYESERTKTDGK